MWLLMAAASVSGQARGGEGEGSLRRQLKQRGLDPAAIVLPHAIDERMVEWLEEAVPRRLTEEQKLTQLLEELLGRNKLDLQYHQGYTGTAIETFESGQANCLAFTHLFVGLSRQLKLPVFYLKVNDLQSFEREGDLVVVSGHITAGYGSANQPRILEFTIFPAAEYRSIRPLSDLGAVALFYSNRGAELLLEGDREGALEWLEIAVQIDPALPEASTNLGVVYRRLGRLEDAEAAYRHALEVDPEYTSAYRNLSALLLRIEGRKEEGRQILELTDQKQSRNPFNYLALGDLAVSQGHLADAERYYRRSLKLGPELAETSAAMGQWELAAGRRQRARRWYRKAAKLDPEHARVRSLAEALH